MVFRPQEWDVPGEEARRAGLALFDREAPDLVVIPVRTKSERCKP